MILKYLIIISGYTFRPHGPFSGLNFIVTLIQIYVNVTFEISIVLHGYVVLILWLKAITGTVPYLVKILIITFLLKLTFFC